jgi:uncharacterized repeat protein (TIGR01451 family)
MKNNLLVGSLTFIGATLLFSSSAIAAEATTTCTPIYGGGETCIETEKLSLDKKVQNPTTKVFVDSLAGTTDPKYRPGTTILFRITVTNTSDAEITDIEVKDTLPQYVTFVKGLGTYDSKTRVLTYKIDRLGAGRSNTVEIQATTAKAQELPSKDASTCIANYAYAKKGTDEASDNARFCITKEAVTPTQAPSKPVPTTQQTQPGTPPRSGQATKGGLPIHPTPNVTTNPNTGPEALSLLALIPTGIAGLMLKKKKFYS